MKEGKGKSRYFLIGFLILITLIAAVISFQITNSKQKTDLALEQVDEVKTENTDKDAEIYDFKDFFSTEDDIFIESYYGSNDIIELNEDEIDVAANIFENHSVKYIVTSNNTEISYLYAVHIKNKNIKLKLNKSYLLLERPEEIALYSVENEGLKDLITELEEVYMVKYNKQDVFHQANSIKILSKDEGLKWKLSPKEIEELEKEIYLETPIGENEVMNMPRSYPDYYMDIKTNDKEYSISLINKEVLAMDSGDSITYYKYKSSLWEYIIDMYSVENSHSIDEFQYLLKSNKIVIDAEDDNFDIEDDTFYHVEIPRYIISAEKKPIDTPLIGEELVYTMFFTVNGKEHKVEIYENQIIYNGQAYYSEKIGEAIMSMLNV